MKIILIVVLVLLVGVLVYYHLRIRRFVANAGPLHDAADQFATDYFLGDATKPQLEYVALGDSTAYGVGASSIEKTYTHALATAIAANGYYVHVRTFGRSGAQLSEVIKVQLPKVPERVDLVTISVGGNDATHLTVPTTYRALTDQLFKGLAAKQPREVVIGSTTDMALTPAIPPIARNVVGLFAERQNREMRPAALQAHAAYVDLYTYAKLDRPSLYASDLFHPGDDGYAKWIPLFVEAVSYTHAQPSAQTE
ncbi:MAG: SGNH/GDSL hydrolase family protein [Patescibacteria group bacterium]